MSDLISRQDAIDYIKTQKGRPFIGITLEEAIIMMIEEVPSVQPRKGKWIFIHPLQMDGPVGYMCSNCKTGNFDVNPKKWKSCPWCMADMREGEQDECNC